MLIKKLILKQVSVPLLIMSVHTVITNVPHFICSRSHASKL